MYHAFVYSSQYSDRLLVAGFHDYESVFDYVLPYSLGIGCLGFFLYFFLINLKLQPSQLLDIVHHSLFMTKQGKFSSRT